MSRTSETTKVWYNIYLRHTTYHSVLGSVAWWLGQGRVVQCHGAEGRGTVTGDTGGFRPGLWQRSGKLPLRTHDPPDPRRWVTGPGAARREFPRTLLEDGRASASSRRLESAPMALETRRDRGKGIRLRSSAEVPYNMPATNPLQAIHPRVSTAGAGGGEIVGASRDASCPLSP